MGTNTRTGRAGTNHIHLAAFVALLAVGAAACGADDASQSASVSTDAPASEEYRADAGGDEGLVIGVDQQPAEAAADTEAPATGGATSSGAPIDTTFGRELIVEAGVTMLTPNVRDAVDDVIRLAAKNGGAVFNADVTVDDPLDDGTIPGFGSIVIRIPPAQLDRLIQDLRGVGTLRNQTQSVDDVTEQLIDLDIQITQAFQSVERMQEILSGVTDFDSLVAAETELVRRQTAYERLLAAQRNLDDRVALSTLTVQIEYRSPAVDDAPVVDDSGKGISDAFSDGWNAFAGVLFGVAFVLAVTAPFLAVGLAVLLLGWLVSRRLRRRESARRNRHEPMDEPLPFPTSAPTSATTPVEHATVATVSEPDRAGPADATRPE
jgi:hypothetical protein